MKPLETTSCTSPTFHFLFNPSTFSSSFFFLPSALGEDEALAFARICFPAAARALRWIEGICMGWGGESKRCEGEQEREGERCYCWGTANEGCREGRREREERKGGIVTQIRKQQSCPVPRGQTLHWEWAGRREDWLLPAVDAALTPAPPLFFALPFNPAACLEPQRTVSLYRRSKKIRVLAEQLCLQLCYLLYHPVLLSLTHTRTPKCSHRLRELSLARTHLHADKQAGRQAHPLPLSVRRAILLILVWAARGCTSLLSSSSSRTGPEESSHHQRSHTSFYNWRQAPLFLSSPSSFFSLLLSPLFPSWCDAVLLTFPSSPSSLSLFLLSVCQWDSHGGHPHLQPCHLLPGVWTPGTAHASQWVARKLHLLPPDKSLASCMSRMSA